MKLTMRIWMCVICSIVSCIAACGGGGGSGGGGAGGGGGGGAGGGGGGAGQTIQQVASQSVDSTGGTVAVSNAASPLDGTKVVIPAGALSSPTTITVGQVTSGSGQPANVLVTNLGPSGTKFSPPASVSIKYSQQYLTDHNITDPNTLKVVAMDPGTANDTLGTTSIDTVNHLVTAQTTHFSNFAVLGYTNASLNGPYKFVTLRYEVGTQQNIAPPTSAPLPQPKGFTSDVAPVTTDGAGGYTVLAHTRNVDGVLSNALSNSGTYSILPDGTLSAVSVNTNLKGAVLAGGTLVVLNSPAGALEISIGIQQVAGTFSNATLSGDYVVVKYQRNSLAVQNTAPAVGAVLPAPKGFVSSLINFNFDGQGNFTATEIKNQDGIITNLPSQTGTYTVGSDGTLTFTGTGFTGTVLAGGSVLALAATVSGTDPGLMVGVQKSPVTFSLPVTSGRLKIVDFENLSARPQNNMPPAGTPLPVPLGFRGAVFANSTNSTDANGESIYNNAVIDNEDGTTVLFSESGAYTVRPDGSLTAHAPIGFTGPYNDGQFLAGGAMFVQ